MVKYAFLQVPTSKKLSKKSPAFLESIVGNFAYSQYIKNKSRFKFSSHFPSFKSSRQIKYLCLILITKNANESYYN